MQKAILGKKIGMTQLFGENGVVIPVTVIEAGPCPVVQKKDMEKDGYESVQIAFLDKKEKHTTKPLQGHYKKAGVGFKRYLKEFKLDNYAELNVGDEIKVDTFTDGDIIDVTGTSKGHGFAGTVKRHGTGMGPRTHGSHYHRGPGAMAGCSDPGRVFKGKKLPGHMGVDTVTIQNLELVKVDIERNLLLVKGAVPGPKGGLVVVRNAVKGGK